MDTANVAKIANIRGKTEKMWQMFCLKYLSGIFRNTDFFPEILCPKFTSPKFLVINVSTTTETQHNCLITPHGSLYCLVRSCLSFYITSDNNNTNQHIFFSLIASCAIMYRCNFFRNLLDYHLFKRGLAWEQSTWQDDEEEGKFKNFRGISG